MATDSNRLLRGEKPTNIVNVGFDLRNLNRNMDKARHTRNCDNYMSHTGVLYL